MSHVRWRPIPIQMEWTPLYVRVHKNIKMYLHNVYPYSSSLPGWQILCKVGPVHGPY